MLVFFIYTNFDRCRAELEAHPAQNEPYHALMARFEQFNGKWLPPFSQLPRLDRSPGATVLNDVDTCIAIHSVIQLGIGYIFPLAILFVEEASSRYIFAENYPVECSLRNKYLVLMLQHLALVPFETMICFRIIVALLEAMRTMGWRGG